MVIHSILLNFTPDYAAMGRWEEAEELTETLRPLGYTCLTITLTLIGLGFVSKLKPTGFLGSLTLYLPVFGYFACTMFFLAGVGVLRILWLPLLDVSPLTLKLGFAAYLPFLCLEWLLKTVLTAAFKEPRIVLEVLNGFRVVSALTLIGLGVFIFFLGASAWLYCRFKLRRLADIWIYRYCRHPQYFGFTLWSYGLLLFSTYVLYAPRGGYIPPPSLPWLTSTLALVGLSLAEEIDMTEKYGKEYLEYRGRTSFMLPLPKQISKLLSAPLKALTGKEYPTSRVEVIYLLILYYAILLGISYILVETFRL